MSNLAENERRHTMLVKHWDWYHECFQISCTLQRDPSVNQKVYCSRITGPDSNYILARDFVMRSHFVLGNCNKFCFSLDEDGIYEFVIKTIDSHSDEIVSVERRWLIVFDHALYEYDGEELSYQYVLYTVYNLNLQSSPEDDKPAPPSDEDRESAVESSSSQPLLRLL